MSHPLFWLETRRIGPTLSCATIFPVLSVMALVAESTIDASLADPAFLRRVNKLREVDPISNWYYLFRENTFIALVLAAAVWLMEAIISGQLLWIWEIPGLLAANLSPLLTQSFSICSPIEVTPWAH